MKQNIELAIKWLIYAIFFVPLLVLPSSYIFPFIVPKIVFFRTLVEIMSGAFCLLLMINWKQYAPKNTFLNLALLCFLLSFAISTFVGVDTYHSFWDNHERMLGLFTVLHYVAFYFVAQSVFKDWKDWKIAGRIFLLGGFVVMFIGWLQTQNPDLLLNSGSDRVASTLGNPIYVGGYGLFLTFLSLLLLAREKDVMWKWFYGIVGLFGFMGIFWSGTRGALLGLVAAVAFAIISYIIVLKNYPKIRYSLLGLMIFGVIVISLLYSFRQTNFVQKLPAIGRAVNTSFSDIETSPRWIAWQIALQSFKEKPVFGWGPNNYFYAFNAHYNPRSLDFGYGETWFDNAHNILLNTLAVQGGFGLLTYLVLYGTAIWSLFGAYRAKKIDHHFTVIAGAFLVAHFVSVVTVFEDPTSYIYLMFWFGLINIMTHEKNILEKGKSLVGVVMSPDKKLGNGNIISVSLLFALFIFIFNIQPARANQKALDAIRAVSQDPIFGITAARDALEFNSPHIDDIRSDVGRSVAQVLSSGWQKVGKEKSNELLSLAVEHLEKNLILHPLDVRNQLSLAQMYQLQAQINNDGNYILKAESVTADALSKSPRRQQIIYSLSGLKMQINKSAEAAQLLEQTIQDNPRIAEGYWRLAYAYKMSGHEDKVKEVLKLAQDNGIKFTDQEQGIVNQLLLPVDKTVKLNK